MDTVRHSLDKYAAKRSKILVVASVLCQEAAIQDRLSMVESAIHMAGKNDIEEAMVEYAEKNRYDSVVVFLSMVKVPMHMMAIHSADRGSKSVVMYVHCQEAGRCLDNFVYG